MHENAAYDASGGGADTEVVFDAPDFGADDGYLNVDDQGTQYDE